MHSIRSFLTLVLVILCVAGISFGAVAAEKVKLFFGGRAISGMSIFTAWQDAMNTYVQENPYIEFNYVGEGGHEQWREKLLVLAAAGNLPDILHIYNPWAVDFIHAGLIEPIPTETLNRIKGNFNPQSLISAEYQGKQYGLPTEFMVSGLMYNKKLLSEAGMVSVPDTWENMATTGKRLMAAQPEGTTKKAIMSFNGDGWGWTATWFALMAAYGAPYNNEAGEVVLDNPISRRMLQMIVEWFGEDMWAKQDWNTNLQFYRGEVPFGFGFPWYIWQFSTYMGDIYKEQIAVTKMPAGPAGIGGYQYGWGMYVSSQSKAKNEAWRFVEWMATEPRFQGLSAIGNYQVICGSLPTNRREISNRSFAEISTFINGFLDNLPYTITEVKLPAADKRQNALYIGTEEAIAKKKTPEQALLDIATNVKILLAEATKK